MYIYGNLINGGAFAESQEPCNVTCTYSILPVFSEGVSKGIGQQESKNGREVKALCSGTLQGVVNHSGVC